MTSEVIIDVQPKEIQVALLEDKRLMEFQREGRAENFSVGNVYLARVRKIMPGLNACFVNVGHERDAFLHYLDLGEQFTAFDKYLSLLGDGRRDVPLTKIPRQPSLDKDGNVRFTLSQGKEILVQIVKEPINTKGPRLTAEISFAGRYLVLMPFQDKVSVSTKIKRGAERARLKQLIQSIKPQGFGVIVRTAAEDKRASELDAEIRILHQRWLDAIEKVKAARRAEVRLAAKTKAKQQQNAPSALPALCYEETGRVVALLRDIFNPSFENIYVNDTATCEEIRAYCALIAPERKDLVKLYRGSVPIFDNFGVTRQIKTSLGRNVTYKHGAYLVIDHTEAMHVVDVNSGNRARFTEDQEANALEVNLGAADELARQLRLRDMGGIVVVDFIDMAAPENRQALYERMTENMRHDRARHTILPLSKFGLMQITRQRVRPAMDVKVEEKCPSCGGTGTIHSSLLFTESLEKKIQTLTQQIGIHRFRLHVHPYVAAYINQGLYSIKRQWRMKYGFGIKVVPNQGLAFLEARFYDTDGSEIELNDD